MARLRISLRRLRWKFALSYMLVTTAILLLVEFLIIGISLLSVWYQATRISPLMDVVSDQISYTLDTETADLLTPQSVDRWLTGLKAGTLQFDPARMRGLANVLNPATIKELQKDGFLAVVDPQLRVLGQIEQDQPPPSLQPVVWPSNHLPLLAEQALHGERSVQRLALYADKRFQLVVPIVGPNDQIQGLVLVVYPADFIEIVSAIDWLPALVLSLIIFSVGSGISGVIFGIVVARPLVRRLHTMANVATDWAGGNFEPSISDRSQDEVGRLGRQLNGMALQLHELLQTQRYLSRMQERNRVARDLHDSVKQQMFAITMNLGTVQALWETAPEQARARLDLTFEVARQCQQELQAIIATLRPIELEQNQLPQALRRHLDLWSHQTGIAVHYTPPEAVPLDDGAAVTVLRVAQEALANVARHSGATAVTLRLTLEEASVRLEIVDNGHGFDAAALSAGLGLRSMRERAAASGGTLTLTSAESGTCVRLLLPVEPPLAE